MRFTKLVELLLALVLGWLVLFQCRDELPGLVMTMTGALVRELILLMMPLHLTLRLRYIDDVILSFN